MNEETIKYDNTLFAPLPCARTFQGGGGHDRFNTTDYLVEGGGKDGVWRERSQGDRKGLSPVHGAGSQGGVDDTLT